MSILIKGMEMPENCAECERWSICKCLNDFEDYESICYAVEDGDLVRDANCPLIELPPHGRLIDAYELMTTIREHDYRLYDRLTDTTKPGMFTFGIEYAVCTAPTIIEAEEDDMR